MLIAGLAPWQHIIRAVLLVRGDKVRIVDTRQGHDGRHLLPHHGLERRLKHGRAVHGVGEVHPADVPAAHDQVVWVDHGQDVAERDVDVAARERVGAELHRRPHDDGAVVVGRPLALARLPGQPAPVGDDARRHRGAVVAAQPDEHHPDPRHPAVHLEVVERLARGGRVPARDGVLGHARGPVRVARQDLGVGVPDVGRVHREQLVSAAGPGMVVACDGGVVIVTRGIMFRVRSHGDQSRLVLFSNKGSFVCVCVCGCVSSC